MLFHTEQHLRCCLLLGFTYTLSCSFVLVLAGIELIFFIVASTGLCFGFVLKTVLIIQGCFHYCRAVLTQSQGLFCFSPHPTSEKAGGAQEVGRGHSWDS